MQKQCSLWQGKYIARILIHIETPASECRPVVHRLSSQCCDTNHETALSQTVPNQPWARNTARHRETVHYTSQERPHDLSHGRTADAGDAHHVVYYSQRSLPWRACTDTLTPRDLLILSHSNPVHASASTYPSGIAALYSLNQSLC